MEEPGSTGRLTRSQAKKRPASTPLRSPMLTDIFPAAAARKQARTTSRAAPTLRSIRKRGGSGDPVQLTGHLGLLPQEVRAKPVPSQCAGPLRRIACLNPPCWCCWAVGVRRQARRQAQACDARSAN